MKEILLSQGKVSLVDDEDFTRLNDFKWFVIQYGRNWYAGRKTPNINGKQKQIRMHREVINALPGVMVDHKDGNGLNNCKENLRFCNRQQNGFNIRHPRKDNKLGVKGVSWHKRDKRFQAQIGINGKVLFLGYFTVLADADQAYRVAELKYFREFTRSETKKLYGVEA